MKNDRFDIASGVVLFDFRGQDGKLGHDILIYPETGIKEEAFKYTLDLNYHLA